MLCEILTRSLPITAGCVVAAQHNELAEQLQEGLIRDLELADAYGGAACGARNEGADARLTKGVLARRPPRLNKRLQADGAHKPPRDAVLLHVGEPLGQRHAKKIDAIQGNSGQRRISDSTQTPARDTACRISFMDVRISQPNLAPAI